MDFEQTRPGEGLSPKADQPREAAGVGMGAVKKKSAGDSKNMNPLFLGIAALLAIATLFLFIAKNNLAAKNQELQGQLDAAVSAKALVEQQLSETTAIKDNLEKTVEQMTRDAEALAAQIEQEKRLKESALAQVDQQIQELNAAKQSLEAERKEKATIKEQFKKDMNSLNAQLEEAKTAKESLEKKLKQTLAKKGIKLEKIVVKPETGELISEGQVLVVNKEFDFVVINLGENDGLKVGSRLQVLKDSQILGTVEVEKIYGNMSAATIMPDIKKDQLKEGCAVRLM